MSLWSPRTAKTCPSAERPAPRTPGSDLDPDLDPEPGSDLGEDAEPDLDLGPEAGLDRYLHKDKG